MRRICEKKRKGKDQRILNIENILPLGKICVTASLGYPMTGERTRDEDAKLGEGFMR